MLQSNEPWLYDIIQFDVELARSVKCPQIAGAIDPDVLSAPNKNMNLDTISNVDVTHDVFKYSDGKEWCYQCEQSQYSKQTLKEHNGEQDIRVIDYIFTSVLRILAPFYDKTMKWLTQGSAHLFQYYILTSMGTSWFEIRLELDFHKRNCNGPRGKCEPIFYLFFFSPFFCFFSCILAYH